jgi:hypothetical protein
MNFVPAPVLCKDHHYVLENTSCSLVMHVPLTGCTTDGKLILFDPLFSLLLLWLIMPSHYAP